MEAVQGIDAPHITLTARREEASRILFQVSDNGTGIPPNLLDQIFTPFFTTKSTGSGVGLSLARQIMQMHKGSISVKSEEGEGTTFGLRF